MEGCLGENGRKKWGYGQVDKSRKGRKKGWIRIEMSDIKISGPKEDDLVEIRFSQRYNSPIFSVRSEKRLILRKEGMGWKIISERSSS